MTRKELNEYLLAEVYKDSERLWSIRKCLARIYARNFISQRRAVYLVRRMQYYHSKTGVMKIYADWLQRKIWSEFGCFISKDAKIGKGFHLAHPTGVVVGVAAQIGENVSLYQQVTIGGG